MTAEYPDYRKVIPNNPGNRLTTGRQSLTDAVDRVKLMAPENVSVHLTMDDNGLSVSCRNNDLGHAEEVLDAKFEGEKDSVTIAFNGNYLMEGLDATVGDEVTIDVRDDSTAAALRSTSSDEFLYVLMPVKVT
jgi:DNA polymerase-3 subunit beta